MNAGNATRPGRQTYSISEAATMLGIGRGSAYRAVRSGELEATKIGKRLLVPHAVLDRLLQTKK